MTKQFILDIVCDMTIEEKAAQLTQLGPFHFDNGVETIWTGPYHQWNLTPEMIQNAGSVLGGVDAAHYKEIQENYLQNNRHKIPLIFMADIIHGMKTIFPIPLALGCSFNTELAEKTAEIAALESAVTGIHVTFSPMVDLVRDPRWGRVMESTGEDPYLNAQMAAAFVRGYQGEDIKDQGRIAACVKHFAAYGAPEGGREYNTVDISRGILRETYLPGYKAALDAGAQMVMTAFNVVERVPASANKWLLRDLLRDEWGFDGVVISDFSSVSEIINHSVAENSDEAAVKCVTAGLDIDMLSGVYINSIPKMVKEGLLAEELVDEAVIRILELKDRLGLFDNPYKDADPQREKEVLGCRAHRDIARASGAECSVLLENKNNILPLDKKSKIGVAGPFASTKNLFGGWGGHGESAQTVSFAEGLQEVVGINNLVISMDSEAESMYLGFVDVPDDIAATIERMKDCDILIAAVGECQGDTGEAASKTNIRLSPNQEALIKAMKETGKPVITVLFSGRPMELQPILDSSDALLQAWYLGSEMGHTLADIIFGDQYPSGRLTMTIPKTMGQIPIYYNAFNTGRPNVDVKVDARYASRYIDCENEPLYPFGYGLSYASFAYDDFIVTQHNSGTNNTNDIVAKASITVHNTSEVEGKEVVQLYIRDVCGSLVRPLKELKGFQKVMLAPGEKTTISFNITKEMLLFYDNSETMVFEPGEFDIMIGRNSQDVSVERIRIK